MEAANGGLALEYKGNYGTARRNLDVLGFLNDPGANVIVVGRLQQRSWETQEGDKRTVVEIEADEVGPSLRWATAKVEKQGRSGGAGAGADWGSERVAAGVTGGGEETPLDAG